MLRNILIFGSGAVAMFLILYMMKKKQPTQSKTKENFKKVAQTEQFKNVLVSEEFKKLAQTPQFKKFILEFGNEQILNSIVI